MIVCLLMTVEGKIASSARLMFFIVTAHLTIESLFYVLKFDLFCLFSICFTYWFWHISKYSAIYKTYHDYSPWKNGRTKMTVSAENDQGERNSTDLWKKKKVFLVRKFVTFL